MPTIGTARPAANPLARARPTRRPVNEPGPTPTATPVTAAASTPTRLVFDSVSFENFSNDWKARETYEVISADEFVEVFELAEPGKEFQVYSRNHFRRSK